MQARGPTGKTEKGARPAATEGRFAGVETFDTFAFAFSFPGRVNTVEVFTSIPATSAGRTFDQGVVMMSVRWVLGASLVVLFSACGTTEKHVATPADDPHAQHEWARDPDSNLGFFKAPSKRDIAAQSDERERYAHKGSHNFDPGTPKGTTVVDTNDKDKFRAALSTFKDPKAVSENYEYQVNREDVVARHTFVLAGADRKLGHHVAFFESRHQHHALVKLEFDFTGAGLKPGAVNPADLKAGRTLFETKILKEGTAGSPALPPNQYYAVQVSPLNPEFELITIPTGITRTFLGSLATITSDGKVTRFNAKGADVVVKITGVHHFSRMYVKESASTLQYLAFSANVPGNKAKLVLSHVIQGSLAVTPDDGSLNMEQMLEAEIVEPAGFDLKEGSIVQFQDRPTYALLQTGDVVEGNFFREGGAEVANTDTTPKIKLKIGKVAYSRRIGIDAGQDAVRKKVRGQ